MKKFVIIGSVIAVLVVVVATISFFFGNDERKIEDLFNKTTASLEHSGVGLKNLFVDEAKKYCFDLDADIKEAADFYQGKTQSVENLYICHKKANSFVAHAKVNTDKDSYFICITTTGARFVDQTAIRKVILEKYDTFKHKKVIQKQLIGKYLGQARNYGVTVRTPGDHDTHIQENKMIKKMEKRDKLIEENQK